MMAPRLSAVGSSNVSNELIASFDVEVSRAQREIDEATGRKRAILARAKKSGIKTKALLAAQRLRKDDSETANMELRDLLRYAGVIAPGIEFSQASLFDGMDDRPLNAKVQGQVQDWDAEQAGYDAGLNGGALEDSPFPAGSEAQTHYHTGYTRGQRVIAERMGDNARQADAGLTKRRGRAAEAPEPEPDADERRQIDLEDAIQAGNA